MCLATFFTVTPSQEEEENSSNCSEKKVNAIGQK